MGKVLAYLLGVISGIAVIIFIGDALHIIDPVKSAKAKALEVRMESIPIEDICAALFSGKTLGAEDRVTIWTDGTRYLLGGWIVEDSGIPDFYWTGADLPVGEPACTH